MWWTNPAEETRWAALWKLMDYESQGDESEFSILYCLYRQKRKGAQVRRDFFPFCTWDSGPDSSGFSFLWRFFQWERKGDKLLIYRINPNRIF